MNLTCTYLSYRLFAYVCVESISLLADITKLQNSKQHQSSSSSPLSLFTVVLAGEYNSGKSTLINALLGSEFQESGVLPTTDAITILIANDNGDTTNNDTNSADIDSTSIGLDGFSTQLHLLPTKKYPILSDLCLIDTPGTNAILSLQHTSSTLRILHDADLIVFVTSADRPFSESEKQLLQTSIKSYRKRVILVINKMDILERQQGEDHGEETKQRVEDYVIEHASDLLGARPVVIPLSARDALSVKLLYNSSNGMSSEGSDNDQSSLLWKRSNFASLEDYLSKTLTTSSKIRTKMLNPIGVVEGVLRDCQHEIERRTDDLEVDATTLRLLTSQTEAWEKEIQTDVIDKCQSDIGQVIIRRSQVAKRVIGELSLLDQLKIGYGMSKDIFDSAWEHVCRHNQPVSITPNTNYQNALENKLSSITNDCVDKLSSRAQRQGNDTLEYLGKRPAIINGKGGKMVGSVSTPKFQRLKELHPSMISVIQSSTEKLPNDSESRDQVYKSLSRSALFSSLFTASALIPGTLSMLEAIETTTGALGSTTLAVMGCIFLPIMNRQLSKSFEKECTNKTVHLQTTLDRLLDNAMDNIKSDIADSIAPYSRYVKSEGEHLKELTDQLDQGIASTQSLRTKINKACQ